MSRKNQSIEIIEAPVNGEETKEKTYEESRKYFAYFLVLYPILLLIAFNLLLVSLKATWTQVLGISILQLFYIFVVVKNFVDKHYEGN